MTLSLRPLICALPFIKPYPLLWEAVWLHILCMYWLKSSSPQLLHLKNSKPCNFSNQHFCLRFSLSGSQGAISNPWFWIAQFILWTGNLRLIFFAFKNLGRNSTKSYVPWAHAIVLIRDEVCSAAVWLDGLHCVLVFVSSTARWTMSAVRTAGWRLQGDSVWGTTRSPVSTPPSASILCTYKPQTALWNVTKTSKSERILFWSDGTKNGHIFSENTFFKPECSPSHLQLKAK